MVLNSSSSISSAVLINRGHTYTDILLPIGMRERRLLDAIDGERSIGEIAGTRGQLQAARGFFERLFWHDQVAFDASGVKASPLPAPQP